jgi:polyphosphate kinase
MPAPRRGLPLSIRDMSASKRTTPAPGEGEESSVGKDGKDGNDRSRKRKASRDRDADGNAADPGDGDLKRKDYDGKLRKLHVELVRLQHWVQHEGQKICIVFEGRDGAGKGGTIKAITERVSPRVFRVVALPAPTEREKSQMYVQRYLPHLPAAGEVVIFDRSWYNRAGVERVMGFCTAEEVESFLKAAPIVEKTIVGSGIILLKYWLEVSQEEQTRRLEGRIEDGRKLWKLSPMDLESYTRWDDYSRARDTMFAATDTPWAPWYVAHSNHKRRARLNIISHLLGKIPYESARLDKDKVKLPKRKPAKYESPDYPWKLVPEAF